MGSISSVLSVPLFQNGRDRCESVFLISQCVDDKTRDSQESMETSRDLSDASWFDQSASSLGLVDEEERLPGCGEQLGDDGKGKESQRDEDSSQEVNLSEKR